MKSYAEFLASKRHLQGDFGFDPKYMPDMTKPFQKYLIEWACRKGRSAIFADCGLGKSLMQLAWADNVLRHTGKSVLILTPLAVAGQTVKEGEKFGIECAKTAGGDCSKPGIYVANYEKLHHFRPDDFDGLVCDESSILKNYAGATRNQIIEFCKKMPHRLLCTATPSPNDYTELGNSAEALGVIRRVEMLATYFTHDGGDTGKWALKGHGVKPFWSFVAGWARAVRRPSDIGFDDAGYILPEMRLHSVVLPSKASEGRLFAIEAKTLDEQRKERKQSIVERCESVAKIANESKDSFIAWCSFNDESTMMAKLIDGAEEITGSDSDERKEELIQAFQTGELRSIVTKPSLAGFGLNWQHCHRMSFFPSHSHEQFYQCLRRCWRFGQEHAVDVHMVSTEAEALVVENMRRKESQVEDMFSHILDNMKVHYNTRSSQTIYNKPLTVPMWLQGA